MSAGPLPAVLDDISVEWLDSALRAGGRLDVEVAAITVEPLGPGHGLLGDLARVRSTYAAGTGPATFIVKLPASEAGSRQVGTMLRAWAREVAFYNEVAAHARQTRLATCFFAGAEAEAGRWVVLLEDCPADDFDFLAGASQAQAFAAVDAIADFHAVWWQSAQTFDWMPGFDTTGVGGLQPLWLDNLPVFLDRYHDILPAVAAEWIRSFAPRLADWSARAAAQPLTMVHADYRIDNLLFAGDEVTIIDWQTTMRAPAAMDLSCFIATSLEIEHRRTVEDSLIDRYLDRLHRGGVAVDRTWFRLSYDENLLWWMGQFGNNLAHLRPGDEMVQRNLDVMAQRVYTAGLDRNVGRLVD